MEVGWWGAMTKPESKRSAAVNATGKCATSVSGGNASLEPDCPSQSALLKANAIKQTSREGMHRRNTECEVYDDGTNTFFW